MSISDKSSAHQKDNVPALTQYYSYVLSDLPGRNDWNSEWHQVKDILDL